MDNAPNLSTMYFTPTGPDEVIKIIQSFKTKKKSTGDDGISMHLLKQFMLSSDDTMYFVSTKTQDIWHAARIMFIKKS